MAAYPAVGVAKRQVLRAPLLLSPPQYSPANSTVAPTGSVRLALLEENVVASVSVFTYRMTKSLSLTLPPLPLRPLVHWPPVLHDMSVLAMNVTSPFWLLE